MIRKSSFLGVSAAHGRTEEYSSQRFGGHGLGRNRPDRDLWAVRHDPPVITRLMGEKFTDVESAVRFARGKYPVLYQFCTNGDVRPHSSCRTESALRDLLRNRHSGEFTLVLLPHCASP